jgi:hypothetical protein
MSRMTLSLVDMQKADLPTLEAHKRDVTEYLETLDCLILETKSVIYWGGYYKKFDTVGALIEEPQAV